MKNIRLRDYILIGLLIFLPYNLVGEGFIGAILCFVGGLYILKEIRGQDTIFLIFQKEIVFGKHFRFNKEKVYLYLLLLLLGFAAISFAFSKDFMSSLNGFTLYIDAFIFYLYFLFKRRERSNILKAVVIMAVASSVIFIIYEGLLLGNRIEGTIGYANTYALLLIVALYLNNLMTKEKLKWLFELLLILGVIYTGSRNSLLYLLIYILIITIYDFKEKKLLFLVPAFLGVLIYICLEYLGIGIVFVLPIVIYIGYIVANKLSFKVKNYFTAALIVLSIFSTLVSQNDYIERVKNISLKTPVLQERFVYFEDALKSIVKNPLGHGISSFEYMQYGEQSAFYDVKYIHNSMLQIGYDLGILGMIIFLCIAIYGAYILYNIKGDSRKYFLPIYLSIFFHSILDFDFSYPTIFIIFVMLIGLARGGEKETNYFKSSTKVKNEKYAKNLNTKVISGMISVVIVFSVYLISVNFINLIAGSLESSGKLQSALSLYRVEERFTIKNPKIYGAIAQVYNNMYENSKDDEVLKICIENLKKAESINPYNPIILGNLAFSYEKLGDEKQAISYYEEFIAKEKYYHEIYVMYKDFLDKRYNLTKHSFYKDKAEELKKIYKQNQSTLNHRAKYMKDQMDISLLE